jgi:UDP-glucose 4-epimerase
MKKVIVTGGAGFIGSHIVELLVEKGFNVVVIDNFETGRADNLSKVKKKITIVKQDISKYSKIENYFKNCQYVFHLAALADIVPSIENPEKYYETNVTGTLNILRASKKFGVKKVLYAASASCYGVVKKFPTDENNKIMTEYPYALTKNLGEQLMVHWSKVFKLSTISLRLFNVYGLRSRTTGAYGAMFGVFLAQKINNKPLTIVGDGKQSRDFTYVTDVANAFYLASRSKIFHGIYNVGTGKPTSVNFVANKIGGEKIFIPKRPGEPDKSQADIKKISQNLKWKPKISLDKGINLLLKNIDDWKSAPVWTPAKISVKTKKWFQYLK